jgi:hypothetical protein
MPPPAAALGSLDAAALMQLAAQQQQQLQQQQHHYQQQQRQELEAQDETQGPEPAALPRAASLPRGLGPVAHRRRARGSGTARRARSPAKLEATLQALGIASAGCGAHATSGTKRPAPETAAGVREPPRNRRKAMHPIRTV